MTSDFGPGCLGCMIQSEVGCLIQQSKRKLVTGEPQHTYSRSVNGYVNNVFDTCVCCCACQDQMKNLNSQEVDYAIGTT